MGVFSIIRDFAVLEAALCKSTQELKEVEKRWNNYFAQLNKFLAGKRDAVPYIDERGKVI